MHARPTAPADTAAPDDAASPDDATSPDDAAAPDAARGSLSADPAHPAGRADSAARAARAARAREALRAAEQRTGARSLSVVPAAEVATTLGSVDAARPTARPTARPRHDPRPAERTGPAGGTERTGSTGPALPALSVLPDEHDRLDQHPQPVPPDRAVPLQAVDTIISTERPPLPVPAELTPLLPAGLRRGITVQVDGSTSVLLALLSEASRAGSWAAVVGAPSIGLLAVAQAGIDLSRLVLVPAPGAQAAPALAALLDGMDVVVVGPEVSLLGADRRRLVARARERASVIVSLRPWPGAHMTLTAERTRWAGIGAGRGRLSSREMTVTRTDRAHGTTYRHTVTLPLARPTVVAPGVAAPASTPAPATAPAAATAPAQAPVAAPVRREAVQPTLAQVG